MRSRRSPRNQERLWRALTPPAPKIPAVASTPRCWDCANYPKGGRARGSCTLRGEMVQGQSENRPCFRERGRQG